MHPMSRGQKYFSFHGCLRQVVDWQFPYIGGVSILWLLRAWRRQHWIGREEWTYIATSQIKIGRKRKRQELVKLCMLEGERKEHQSILLYINEMHNKENGKESHQRYLVKTWKLIELLEFGYLRDWEWILKFGFDAI